MSAPSLGPAYRLIALDTVESTNDEARRLAAEGAQDGTLVWAREQTQGRGRRGRGWSSPRGNLYCSLIMRPAVPAASAAQLSLVAAVGLGEALLEFLPDEAGLQFKWPNDVLIDDGKVAGILLESSGMAGDAVDWIVLGCGVNVVSCPVDTPYPATSLQKVGGESGTVEALLVAFARHFLAWRRRWEGEGITPLRAAWLARAKGLGEPIEVRLPDRKLLGRFAGMDGEGALLLDLPGGGRRTVTAGDVFFHAAISS